MIYPRDGRPHAGQSVPLGGKEKLPLTSFNISEGLGLGDDYPSASSGSDGGGPRVKLQSSSSLSGRQVGGGSRSDIYGTSRYGSGWPYGASGSSVSDRPLPFFFYPIPIQKDYFGAETYANLERLGGPVSTTSIHAQDSNISNKTYHLVGDLASIRFTLAALKRSCPILILDPSSNMTTLDINAPSPEIYPEQVVQWYRASSFALSLDTYNNSAASHPFDGDADTPLPTDVNIEFLNCLNTTIGKALPLVDYYPSSHQLSTGAIVGAVISAIAGLVLLLCVVIFVCRRNRSNRTDNLAESGARGQNVVVREGKILPFKRVFTGQARGKYAHIEDPHSHHTSLRGGSHVDMNELAVESPVWGTPAHKADFR